MTTGYQMLLLTRHQRGVVGTGGGGVRVCVGFSEGGWGHRTHTPIHHTTAAAFTAASSKPSCKASVLNWLRQAIGCLAVIERGCGGGGEGRRPPARPARERSDASLTGACRPEVESRSSLPSGKTKATSVNKHPHTASFTSSRL